MPFVPGGRGREVRRMKIVIKQVEAIKATAMHLDLDETNFGKM